MDGNGEHFTDSQQVDKGPEEGGDKGSHRDKEEKVRRTHKSWWGGGHADDTEDLYRKRT